MRDGFSDWELERAILGGLLLLERDGTRTVTGLLPEDFDRVPHQNVFRLIRKLDASGQPHDLPMVLSRIGTDPMGAEAFGGVAHVCALPNACPSVEALSGYARRLRELSYQRRVRLAAQQLLSVRGDPEETRARVAELGRLMAAPVAGSLPWVRGVPPPPPPPDWLLMEPGERSAAGVLPTGKVGLLAAPGGMGKSSALAWLALSIATGRPWFGLTLPSPGRVVLILAEESAADVARKLHFSAQMLRLSEQEEEMAAANVQSMGAAGRDVVLLRRDPTGSHYPSAFAEQLLSELSGAGPLRAILLDPLSRFAHAESETDAATATRMVEALERLTALPGTPAVIAAHHSRKMGRDRGENASMTGDDIRGSSALRDGVRWAAVLDPHEAREGDPRLPQGAHGAVRLSVVKSNVGRVPAPRLAIREGWGTLRDPTVPELRRLSERVPPGAEEGAEGWRARQERPGQERPRQERPGQERPGQERSGARSDAAGVYDDD